MDDQERQLRAAALEYGHGDALLAEVERICTAPDVRAAYDRQFLLQCATLPADQHYDIRQKLRTRFSAKEFGLKEWDRRIREARKELDVSRGTSAPAWYAALNLSDRGPRPILQNAIAALRVAPEWQGVLAYDQFGDRLTCRALAPWMAELRDWSSEDDIRLADWLQTNGILVDKGIAGDAVEVVARDASFHPVRLYLEALEWSNIQRIDTWLVKYLGMPASPYTFAIGRAWLISAIARVMRRRSQADGTVILEGPQGIGKSSALRILGGDWFTDDISEFGSKDACLQLRGKWIVEISELDAMSRTELSRVKSFLTRQVDNYRPPYARRSIDVPRQSVFAGTTNQSIYLADDENRRFWPATCGAIDLDGLASVRDQLWAEALTLYKSNHPWHLTAELTAAARSEQESRRVEDPWTPIVQEWLEGRSKSTSREVLIGALDMRKGDITKREEMRLAHILKALNWTGTRSVEYGERVRVWTPPPRKD